MELRVDPNRISPMSEAEHVAFITEAMQTFSVSPYLVLWHYMHAAFKSHECNISETARSIGLSRRTVQRILAKRAAA